MSARIYDNFTNKYDVSKTLRFELIPQGETLENMKEHGVLTEDEHLAESYEKVKKIIDEYHKLFIDASLKELRLSRLEEYHSLFVERDAKNNSAIEEIRDSLRKEIAVCFSKHPDFKKLFSKELILELLPNFVKSKEEQDLVSKFDKFTTYFTGFNDVRKNIYTEEAVSSSIGYRLIHENLPVFIQNMYLFEKLKESEAAKHIPVLKRELSGFVSSKEVEDFFSIDGFNRTLTQKGITLYNLVLGGYSEEDGKKVRGLNEYINLYNQTSERNLRLGKLKPLKKQILSDYESLSFIPAKFESDEEVIAGVLDYAKRILPLAGGCGNGSLSMMQLLIGISQYDLERIYLRSDFIKTLSQELFGNWSLLNNAMNTWYDINYRGIRKAGTKAYENEKEKFFKEKDCYSIAFLNECCTCTDETSKAHIESYFERYSNSDGQNYFLLLRDLTETMEENLGNSSSLNKSLLKQKTVKDSVKGFLDTVKEYEHYLKPLLPREKVMDVDHAFYDVFTSLYDKIREIDLLYNKVRNYMTQKPYSTEKIKLNFGNSSLLSGWSLSKERTNGAVIMRKDGLYYLSIMPKHFNKGFEGELPSDGETYEKMDYRLLPGANKMLPKVFLAAKDAIEKYGTPEDIVRIYKNGTFKKGKDFSIDDCHKLIDYFKDCISMHEEWSKFEFKFSDTETYEDISGFYREVEAQGYKISFRQVSKSYIDELVKEGKLYLFQIYNKDFSPYSKGTPNLHTLYFKALFTPENLLDTVYKLNGQAEIFYRKKSIEQENIITHPANEPVSNKNPLNPKKESIFTYTLYKNKRYTMDKFQLHVPVTMNFKAVGLGRLNADVNKVLKENPDTFVIGINRGERHLLYITVVDSNGNIVEQYSLNDITNEHNDITHRVNYHDLLEHRANERDSSRKNWDTIENIKDLKEGYLSQAIHKISQLMVKYQAVVVIEDLNFGFLRGRQAIEKNVYQKFVQMLIDKLNYYVDKKVDENSPGGLYHAYQLTNKFESLKKLGKQNGFLFFAPSYYISNMDPVTGFVNFLYTKYENVNTSKEFLGKFDDIFYDSEKGYFCFDTDYSKFTDKSTGTKEHWLICSQGDRVRTFRNPKKNNQWDFETVFPTKLLENLFNRYNISYKNMKNGELKEQILAQSDKGFFVELYDNLSLILQMRNFDVDADYLVSPVCDKNGEFFDSRDGLVGLPVNVEANGSYNIARKGLWMLEKIRETEDDRLGREQLALSNQEWLKFAQNV